MEKPYMLISVCEREIATEQYPTLEAAQARMLYELETFGGVENPAVGMEEDGEFAIHEMSAWSNVKDDMKQDWLIIHIES